ncbi:MAG: tRNA 2-thiouridine(34) synthase MnmA [Candidatus Electrothrix sp. AR4]|nr:tRNA 2-thiouridine(34) synthase MnmA [Candidatus Electrothrix sp. AR4]
MSNSVDTRTVGVAMSGGVDSTVTVGLLLEQGFSAHGFFMLLPLPGIEEQVHKVRLVADRLQVPLHLVEMRERFSQEIVASFTTSYQQGLTPNPCVLCNRLIKFGYLMEEMRAQGVGRVATGHYAQIQKKGRRFFLKRALDPAKDQSYFLNRLSSEQLESVVFPLGAWRKKHVFDQAQAMGFTHFGGGESQDVCFLADQDLPSFFREQGLESRSGEIATEDGRVLGSHQGIWKYTVGQRRGLGIPDATPWYVIGLDAQENRVIVGKNKDLLRQEVFLSDVQWRIDRPKRWQGRVQLRSRHWAAEAEVVPVRGEDDAWRVWFNAPQRAITPGQFAVFYQDDLVVGSGVIQPD